MYKHRMTYWARICAFVLNLAMLFAGFAIIGVAIWMNADQSFDKDLKSVVFNYSSTGDLAYYKYQTRVWIICVYWSIFGISIGAVAVAIFGVTVSINRKMKHIWTYLGLMITLVLIEIGSGMAILVQRSTLRSTVQNLIYSIFAAFNDHDMQIIKDTYYCCQSFRNKLICNNKPQCTTTVWNNVDNTMMIAGIVLIPILILQIITIICYAPIMIDRRKNKKQEGRFISTNIEKF